MSNPWLVSWDQDNLIESNIKKNDLTPISYGQSRLSWNSRGKSVNSDSQLCSEFARDGRKLWAGKQTMRYQVLSTNSTNSSPIEFMMIDAANINVAAMTVFQISLNFHPLRNSWSNDAGT